MSRRRVRILIFLSAGVIVVLIAGIVLWPRDGSGEPGRSDGDQPGVFALDYHMALIRKDYKKAYESLSPTLNHYPADVNEFVARLEMGEQMPVWSLSPCVYLEGVVVLGEEAKVTLREQLYDPCIAGVETENLTYEFLTVRLHLEAGAWKIVDSSDHFDPCWSDPSRCEQQRP